MLQVVFVCASGVEGGFANETGNVFVSAVVLVFIWLRWLARHGGQRDGRSPEIPINTLPDAAKEMKDQSRTIETDLGRLVNNCWSSDYLPDMVLEN